MNKQEININTAIARRYLDTYHMLLPDEKIMFDCCCLPSFRWKAFYVQVFEENGIYRANCAYTQYRDYFGLNNYSQHFTTIEIINHRAKRGDVFCKSIFPDRKIIEELLQCANEYIYNEQPVNKHLTLDGITARIRLFENGSMTRDIVMIDPDNDVPLLDKILSLSETI